MSAHGSVAARVALTVGLIMAAYASLRPFAGWIDRGMPALAFLHGPISFGNGWDVFLNMLGYAALGAAGVLALAPPLARRAAVPLVALALALFSLAMETLQTYLPMRTPSVTDVVTDACGAALGALLGAAILPWVRAAGMTRLRRRWIVTGALGSIGLVVLALWLLALAAPRITLFAVGDLRLFTGPRLLLFRAPEVFAGFEALIATLALVGVALFVRAIAAPGANAVPLFLLVVAAGLVARACGYALFWTAPRAFDWVTPGALLGLAVGVALGLIALAVPQRIARFAAVAAIVAGVIAVNLAPPDPYLWTKPRPTRQRELAPVSALTRTTASVWPFVACAFLLWPRGARRDPERA